MELSVRSSKHSEMIDITSEVEALTEKCGVMDGFCMVFVTHTTAAVTINENADSDVTADLLGIFEKMIPWKDGYRHMEGNSAAHMKTSLLGSSELIPVSGGKLVLGTWQGIFFCEFDGPRNRSVHVSFHKSN